MKLTVYCGARPGNDPIYIQLAESIGNWMVKRDDCLVYGAGNVGLMGAVADILIQNGKKVIGVIPHFLEKIEPIHPGITELIYVDTMSERKKKMADLGDAFIALPGGPGTLEEITEVISWRFLERHHKPCILINLNNYYTPLQEMYDKMVENGFLSNANRALIHFVTTLDEVDKILQNP